MTPRYNYMPNVPAAGTTALVWVWWLHRDVAATWDGQQWRDGDGAVLVDVLCWRMG